MTTIVEELYLEDLGNYVSVEGDCSIDHQNPDYSTWDSDIDYYGYTEVTDIQNIEVYELLEDGTSQKIDIDKLSSKDIETIEKALEEAALEDFDPSNSDDDYDYEPDDYGM